MDENLLNERKKKLEEIKLLLSNTNRKLAFLTEKLNWDYKKLSKEEQSTMGTCSINPQHRVPQDKIKIHEEKCSWKHQGYTTDEKTFPEYSGAGSCVTLSSESLRSIIEPSVFFILVFLFIMMEFKNYNGKLIGLREVPQTSAKLDQNFNREEKLAIYDYVIANTRKQVSYSDLWLQPTEKSEEKREMAAWEIAAAERDAKRRRASYRNKVHTNRKTHTEILREVIESQMEAFKEEITREEEKPESHASNRKQSPELRESSRRRYDESPVRRNKEDRDKRRSHDKHHKHKEHKRYPSDTGNDMKSRSRSHDKYRKWKSYEGRSHSHRSSHTHTRR